MILKPRVDDLLKYAENNYELVIAVSKRARQIVDGAQMEVNTEEKSPITIATLEFEAEKVSIIRNKENIN